MTDPLARTASGAVTSANRAIGRLVGRLQDIVARRALQAKPEATAAADFQPDNFKAACQRAQNCLHAWGNGYELKNRRMFAQFIFDVRIISSQLHYTVSESILED
jgi:hypothetical protein